MKILECNKITDVEFEPRTPGVPSRCSYNLSYGIIKTTAEKKNLHL